MGLRVTPPSQSNFLPALFYLVSVVFSPLTQPVGMGAVRVPVLVLVGIISVVAVVTVDISVGFALAVVVLEAAHSSGAVGSPLELAILLRIWPPLCVPRSASKGSWSGSRMPRRPEVGLRSRQASARSLRTKWSSRRCIRRASRRFRCVYLLSSDHCYVTVRMRRFGTRGDMSGVCEDREDDTSCEPAHDRVRKVWLVSPPSSSHCQPGIVPLRPERGALPPLLSPALGSGKAFPRCLRRGQWLAPQCRDCPRQSPNTPRRPARMWNDALC